MYFTFTETPFYSIQMDIHNEYKATEEDITQVIYRFKNNGLNFLSSKINDNGDIVLSSRQKHKHFFIRVKNNKQLALLLYILYETESDTHSIIIGLDYTHDQWKEIILEEPRILYFMPYSFFSQFETFKWACELRPYVNYLRGYLNNAEYTVWFADRFGVKEFKKLNVKLPDAVAQIKQHAIAWVNQGNDLMNYQLQYWINLSDADWYFDFNPSKIIQFNQKISTRAQINYWLIYAYNSNHFKYLIENVNKSVLTLNDLETLATRIKHKLSRYDEACDTIDNWINWVSAGNDLSMIDI